jgi:hypothetical protein
MDQRIIQGSRVDVKIEARVPKSEYLNQGENPHAICNATATEQAAD